MESGCGVRGFVSDVSGLTHTTHIGLALPGFWSAGFRFWVMWFRVRSGSEQARLRTAIFCSALVAMAMVGSMAAWCAAMTNTSSVKSSQARDDETLRGLSDETSTVSRIDIIACDVAGHGPDRMAQPAAHDCRR